MTNRRTQPDREAEWTGAQRFEGAPFVAIWEVTRACDPACVNHRTSTNPEREAGELSTDEGKRLIHAIREFGRPLLVLTGGDPLKRDDIYDLIACGHDCGLETSLSPSGTPLLSYGALREAAARGLSAVSVSIDASGAESHDRFRGIEGSFQDSLEGAAATAACNLQLQINTTVAEHNVEDLEAIGELAGGLGARRWSLFFMVPAGRAAKQPRFDGEAVEAVLRRVYEYSKTVPFRIETTAAPHYRRVALQSMATELGVDPLEVQRRSRSGGGRFIPEINDERGSLFISSLGEIYACGFLPLSAGNVRRESILEIYRRHPLFLSLRDVDRLEGRCGACEFRAVCGGSRARAYALTGNLLAEDPACAYAPLGWVAGR